MPVTLTNPSTLAVTVNWTTLYVPGAPDSTYGPQAPLSDYTASSGTVTFAPGDTTATVHIPVNADTLTPGEYIVVSFHDPDQRLHGRLLGPRLRHHHPCTLTALRRQSPAMASRRPASPVTKQPRIESHGTSLASPVRSRRCPRNAFDLTLSSCSRG